MEEGDGESAARTGGRIHSRPAVLYRICSVGMREPAAGEPASERDYQSAFTRLCPYQRHRDEYARICHGLRLQKRAADGEGDGLQGVVEHFPVGVAPG